MIRAALIAVLTIRAACAQDTLSPAQENKQSFVKVSPDSVRFGETACAGIISASFEGHVWIHPQDFRKRSAICLAEVTRLKNGWRIRLHVTVAKIDTDSEFARLGYIRMTEIEK